MKAFLDKDEGIICIDVEKLPAAIKIEHGNKAGTKIPNKI